ncbi:MAG TPA: acetate--CoA ligase [Anaerolineales bacterium]
MPKPMTPLEGEVYHPPQEVAAQAHVPDWGKLLAEADADYLGFWEARARELEWQAPWRTVMDDSRAPFFQWFPEARTNIVHNALDRHVATWRRNKLALIWEGEPGDLRTFSYHALHREVGQFAQVLKSMGAQRGDRITIYMGRIPEIVIAMLACAKIGAIHSVVYGGFSVEALHGRIEDSQSRLLITADGGWLNGKIVRLKDIADEALRRCASVEHVVVVRRTGHEVRMEPGRDFWYDDLLQLPLSRGGNDRPQTEIVDAEHPLYILYTSGTTGKPKAIVHTHGGYQVGTYTTLKYVFDLREEDRWWCAADPGWVTGHSYIVYGPLLNGATSFMYEGAPTYPYPDRWWRMIEKYGITILYTAPTAIRGLMRFGDGWPARHDLSSLRLLGTVGEPINPEAWKWYHRTIGGGRCPIMDTWWQTETGMFMITPVPSSPLKPGSATRPFFGQQAEVLSEDGRPVPDGEEGYLVLNRPWPAMLRTLYRDDERYIQQYWSKYPGKYLTGDSAKRDKDGYFWVIGRVDDVIKVSGYRLGTAEIESALVSHPSVAEAAVIGLPDDLKGHAIHAFCILRAGHSPSPQLEEELKAHVGHEMGPIARPAEIRFTDALPKTRSGKIMRRVLKARALGISEGDTTTLEE